MQAIKSNKGNNIVSPFPKRLNKSLHIPQKDTVQVTDDKKRVILITAETEIRDILLSNIKTLDESSPIDPIDRQYIRTGELEDLKHYVYSPNTSSIASFKTAF